jgi:hypothetical protein
MPEVLCLLLLHALRALQIVGTFIVDTILNTPPRQTPPRQTRVELPRADSEPPGEPNRL